MKPTIAFTVVSVSFIPTENASSELLATEPSKT